MPPWTLWDEAQFATHGHKKAEIRRRFLHSTPNFLPKSVGRPTSPRPPIQVRARSGQPSLAEATLRLPVQAAKRPAPTYSPSGAPSPALASLAALRPSPRLFMFLSGWRYEGLYRLFTLSRLREKARR
jgi:hypothetical protein